MECVQCYMRHANGVDGTRPVLGETHPHLRISTKNQLPNHQAIESIADSACPNLNTLTSRQMLDTPTYVTCTCTIYPGQTKEMLLSGPRAIETVTTQ